jgi:hypothetical protein
MEGDLGGHERVVTSRPREERFMGLTLKKKVYQILISPKSQWLVYLFPHVCSCAWMCKTFFFAGCGGVHL